MSDEETETLEAFFCNLCDDPPDISDADEAVEHLVEDHDVEEDEAEKQIRMLTEGI